MAEAVTTQDSTAKKQHSQRITACHSIEQHSAENNIVRLALHTNSKVCTSQCRNNRAQHSTVQHYISDNSAHRAQIYAGCSILCVHLSHTFIIFTGKNLLGIHYFLYFQLQFLFQAQFSVCLSSSHILLLSLNHFLFPYYICMSLVCVSIWI